MSRAFQNDTRMQKQHKVQEQGQLHILLLTFFYVLTCTLKKRWLELSLQSIPAGKKSLPEAKVSDGG